MIHIVKIATVTALAFAIATPALAGAATESPSARKTMLMKKKTCNKEASAQDFGVHLIKKRAFVKQCMLRT
jgi:hypothetical protein